MFFDKLSDAYIRVEDAWYRFVDALSAKGIPLYAYTDFLDKRGIPSFPFSVALAILLLILLFLTFSSTAMDVSIRFRFADDEGNPLNGVRVSFLNSDEKEFAHSTLSSGSVYTLKNMPFNSTIYVEASKSGFDSPPRKTITVNSKEESLTFTLARQRTYISGRLRLHDAESGTVILNAECSAVLSDKRTVRGRKENELVILPNIPAGEKIEVQCSANGYERFDELLSFNKGEVSDATMTSSVTGELAAGGTVDVLVRALDADSLELIPNIHVTVINSENQDTIYSDTSDNGEYIAKLNKGTIAKVTIEAKGYITQTTKPFTVVEDLAPIELKLKKGGTTVTVSVKSKTGIPLQNVELMLFDEDGRFITSKKTSPGALGGIAMFENLDPNKRYFLTAWKHGFLPFRSEFVPGEKSSFDIELVPSSPDNSATAKFTVLDSEGKPANKAKVRFYQELDGKRMPLGIPPMETDSQGVVQAVLPEGTVEVEAETSLDRKSVDVESRAGDSIDETISMERKASIVELKFVDNEGNPIQGTVRIRSKSGELLFEGRPDKSGSVVFDSKGENSFDTEVETDDGKKFKEEVRIGGEKEAKVTLYTVEEKMKPSIDFAGVFDAAGKEVEGVTRGKYYWLKFVVSWTAIDQAGVQVRLGEDSKNYADSMQYGIYGFDADAKRFFYGTSYQPPRGTREDKLNRGNAGKKNKVLELYFRKPAGQEVVKVKVKALEDSKAKEMLVHYRAWVKAGDKFFRDPEDNDLGTASSTRSKSGFYAETKTASVKIFSSAPKCSRGLCLEFAFFDEKGFEFKPNEFRPVAGNRFALEVRASADSKKEVQLTAETGTKSQTILFSGFSEDTAFPGTGYDKASVSLPSLSVFSQEEAKARVFFEAKDQGAAFIKVTANSNGEEVSKTLYFNVTGPREMSVELTNGGKIKPGEELHISVKDRETSDGITDALISFFQGERLLFSQTGDGTENNGLEGDYLVNAGSLDPGIYSVMVSRRDYVDYKGEVTVSAGDILGIEPEKEVLMESGKEKTIETIELWNNLANVGIGGLQAQFFPRSNWNNNFSIDIKLPQSIRGNGRTTATLNVSFEGEKDSSVYAEGELVVSGVLENGLEVQATSTIKASYNKPVPVECLEITPKKNEVRLLGAQGSSESFDLYIKYLESDKCTDPLKLAVRADKKGKPDEHLRITAPSLTINPGQQKTLSVSVTNALERFTEPGQKEDFSLIIESARVSKSVSLSVYFVNPFLSLQTNDNIHVWATEDEETGKIQGIAPLFMRNVGKKSIDAISVTESAKAEQSGLFSVHVAPTSTGFAPAAQSASVSLAPGEELSPPWKIEVTGKTSDYPEAVYPVYLDVSGSIDGKKYNPMKVVTLWVHVSTAKCLKFSSIDDLRYISSDSSQGVISKKVHLKNNCGEIVREISVVPGLLGQNQLSLLQSGENNILYPGEEADFKLKVLKRSDYFNADHPDKVVARGFLVSSQKFIESNPLDVILMLGQVPDTGKGPAFDAVQIPACGTDKKQLMSVSFPRPAESADCENAYCDAMQFSEFLSGKLLDLVEAAQDRMRTGDYDATSKAFSCPDSAGFCSFSALGVPLQDFSYTVYLRNDSVSADVISEALSKTSLSNFKVEFRKGEISDIIQGATGFSSYHVYVSEPLKGCGRYRFSVNGAVQSASGQLQKDNLILLVSVEENRKVTPECTNKVQNAMNFLPVDGSLTNSRKLGTWVAMVEADQKLHDVGGDFAETLFGRREGRVVLSDDSTNRLNILLKELSEGSIMRLSIDQKSETTATPKKVVLELNALFDSPDEQVRNEIAAKAKEGMKAMAHGSFALDACIGENEQYMVIEKFEHLGEMSIDGEKTIPLYYNSKSCAKLKVSSTIKGEKVVLKTNFSSMNASEKAGLKRVWLETLDGQPVNEYTGENATVLELKAVEGKEGLYERPFLLCAEGDDGKVQQAVGRELKVKAKSASIAKEINKEGEVVVREMPDWFSVKVKICGLHPYDFLEKISGLEPEKDKPIEGYAVLAWKGEPNELSLEAMIAAWKAFKLKQQPGSEEEQGQTLEEQMASARKKSIWMYIGACMAVSTACNFVAFRTIFVPFDWIFDCGVPAIAGLYGEQISQGSRGLWDRLKGFFHAKTADEWIDAVHENTTGNTTSDEEIDTLEENLITGAMAGVSMRGITKFLSLNELWGRFATKPYYSAAQASTAINKTAELVAKKSSADFAEKYLGEAAGRETIEKTIRDTMEKNIRKTLRANATKKAASMGRGGSFKLTDLGIEEAAQGSWNEATKVTGAKIANNPNLLDGSDLERQADSILRKSADDIIDSGKVSGNSVDDLLGGKGEVTIGSGTDDAFKSTDELADALAKKTMDNIDYQKLVSENRALKGMDDDLTRALKRSLRGKTSVDKDALERILHKSVDDVKLRYNDDLFRAAGRNVDEEMEQLFRKKFSPSSEMPERGRFRNFWRSIRSAEFWKRLGKSMACGALANLGGISAQRAYMNHAIAGIKAREMEKKGFSFSGPLAGYEGVESFKKFKPYKATLWKGDYGETRVKIEELSTDEELAAMSAAIAQDAEKDWSTDCDKFMQKGIDELIGCLVPDAEAEGVSSAEVVAYYSNNALIAEVCLKEEPKLEEDLLMAVLYSQPSRIAGCQIADDWFKKSEGERESSIRCAAKQLRKAIAAEEYNADSGNAVLERVIERLPGSSLGNTELAAYTDSVLQKFEVWKPFNMCRKE